MAITEVQEPSEPLKVLKTWVLKVSIHCEGCKKKVKKILNSVPGVYNIEIDVKQHRVVVTGNVEADALLKKLLKSGKHAELLSPPEKHPQKEKKPDESPANKKDKPISQSHDVNNTQETPHAEEGVKPPPATIKPGKPPQVEASDTGPSGGGDGDKVADAAGQSTSGGEVVVEESKADDKKPETDSPGNQTPPPAVEVLKSGESESVSGEKAGVSGNVSKKKKKKGQSGDKPVAEQSSAVPASAESPNHDGGSPPLPPTVPANHSPPRHQGYQYPPSYYYAPSHAPVYAVSYNTAQPSSSYAASYYASPPPQSYVYSYPSQEMGTPPLPLDFDTYPPQPLDSFEMFSDENPNGCSIM